MGRRVLAALGAVLAPALLAYCLLGTDLALAAATADGVAGSGDATLLQLADPYFDDYYFPNRPSDATVAVIHRSDDRLQDLSRAGLRQQFQALHAFERRIGALDAKLLSERVRGDRELLLSNIRSTLLDLETIRPWQKNPDIYTSALTNAAFVIMELDFAPVSVRLQALIARERAMLASARENLRNPPAIYTQIAIEQLPDVIGFFEHDLPSAFKEAQDPALQARFAKANDAVVAALKGYLGWLQHDLQPRSQGDFRLGAETFSAKLDIDEMVDTLLPQFRDTFDGLLGFIESHHIIKIPSTVRPIVRETPPFMRATTFASLDTPGPFETVAKEAYFNVTLPDPLWNAERTNGFLSAFNYPAITEIAAHEAYRGH